MRKGRRSAERLSYWPEAGSRALTRREYDMPRSFGVNHRCFPMAGHGAHSWYLMLLMALMLSTTLMAQGPALTTISDPLGVITVSNGQLQVAGGTGIDGQTLLNFIELVELGGTTMLEHGDIVFNAPSNGVIGGLYAGSVSIAGCLVGFRITPSGDVCNIQALVEGSVAGTPLATLAGHHYVFTTMLYPTETYRMQQVFHSSLHPSGSSRRSRRNLRRTGRIGSAGY